jgi:uncharacterized protein with PQ loop repeat
MPRKTKNTSKLLSEKFAYLFGIVGNIAVIPQIIKAWQSDAPGLAISTWVLFTVVSVVWLWYGIEHRARPLIVAQIIGICLNLSVIIGWSVHNL